MHRVIVALGAATVLAIGVSRAVVLAAPGVPAGIDAGNWLAFADDLLGQGVRDGLAYPPVIPLLTRLAVDTLGPTVGVAVVAALVGAVPALAVLAVFLAAGRPILGVLAGVLVAAAAPLGEALAWGGYPQVLASGAAVLALWGLDRWLEQPSRRSAALGLGAWVVVAWSSHLVALPVVVAGGALCAFQVVPAGKRRSLVLRRALLALGAAALAIVPVAPTYVRLLGETGLNTGTLARVDDLERVLGGAWPLWLVGLFGGPLATVAAVRRTCPPPSRSPLAGLARIACAMPAGWLLVMAVLWQVRYLHDGAVLAPLSAGAALAVLGSCPQERFWRIEFAGSIAGAVVLPILVLPGLAAFPAQRDRYAVLDRPTFAAIEWLRDRSAPGSMVAVPDHGGAPLGWWVEGVARRLTLPAADLRWLHFRAERERAAAAGRFFYAARFPSESDAAAERLGVGHVLLPDREPWISALRRPLPAGWSIVFREGNAVVLATSQARAP